MVSSYYYFQIVSLLNGGLAAYNLVKMNELAVELSKQGAEYMSVHITCK